jgi:RNase P subunit RPR2
MGSAKNCSIPLPCVFFSDVKCSHRKSMKQYVLRQCEVCSHKERFEREMDEDDECIMDKIDEERRTGV